MCAKKREHKVGKNMGDGPEGQRPIQGFRQFERTQKDKEPPVDQEKFKRIVEGTDEAPEKKKRQQAEENDEVAGMNKPQEAIQTNAELEPSPFEVQSTQSMKQQTFSGQKHADMEFIETPEAEVAPMAMAEETPFAPPTVTAPVPEQPKAPPPAPPTPQAQTASTSEVQPAQKTTQPEQPSKDNQQQNQEQQSQTQQTKSTTTPPTEKPTPPKQLAPEKTSAKTQAAPTAEPTKPEDKSKKGATQASRTEESAPVTHQAAEASVKPQKEKHKKTEEEKATHVEGTTHIAPGETAAITPPTETTSPVKLPPAMFELFDKMISYITIEHSKSGLQTTTVKIEMKKSVFNGAELKLERFPTARDTFNINLTSSDPKAVDLFNDNIQQLAAAFAHGRYAFKVNINKAAHATAPKTHRRVEKKEDVN